jgi:hypothetical protein
LKKPTIDVLFDELSEIHHLSESHTNYCDICLSFFTLRDFIEINSDKEIKL